ncbi:MAG TPA: ThuA domain-containing protein [Lacipirellulaceae bacterium]|nr:ThuA domain-containing protein [Lacipirellulaceae bacterium]
MRNLRLALWILFAFSVSWLAATTTAIYADENHPRRLLFFHRSAGFQHSVVTVKDDKPCFAETILRPICEKHHWRLVSTKDGTVFTPENIAKYDAFLFYTTGVLTDAKSADGSKPMSGAGKEAFLNAIHDGKGFVGFHCASDTFHKGERYETQTPSERDAYINMLGGEFVTHCSQQPATMKVVDASFPGARKLAPSFKKTEEWYSLKNFGDDLHVILVNETKGMHDKCYERPPYPATWVHKYGKGRVFYTSMGHREDVWTSPQFQSLIVGGIKWAVGDATADTTPNIEIVTPKANTLPPK